MSTSPIPDELCVDRNIALFITLQCRSQSLIVVWGLRPPAQLELRREFVNLV